MNRKQIYTILVIIGSVILYLANDHLDNKNYQKTQIESGVSETKFNITFLPKSTTGNIISHNFYTLSYSEKHEQAEWVSYELKSGHISKNNFKRPYFVEDKKVKSKSADWRNYKKSGYDKGHLCPAGDRTFDYDAYHETFLTSNISPQNNEFNSGIWNRLEQKTRYWSKKLGEVYVVTGGVLEEQLNHIGEEQVSVPNYFYKIIMNTNDKELNAIAFLIPNEPSSQSFYEYVVTIDEIESRTKIDFFPNLDDELETNLESRINFKSWSKY
jgi:endonuclease G